METQIAIFAGGCFWCTEAIFQRIRGVIDVLPGYTGGVKPNPSYEDVCSGTTGHAEATKITFAPSIVSYETLLDVFFATHDPTTKNRQGADIGTQYRSEIFYNSDEQKNTAEKKIKELDESKRYHSPIVTEISKASEFYVAEDYHKQYFEKNSYQPYCQVVIDPKVQKLLQEFSSLTKN